MLEQKSLLVAEQRNFPRVCHSVPVQLLVRNPGSHEIGAALTTAMSHDLSRSGMRVYSIIHLDNKEIFVRFQSPGGEVLIRSANVVRSTQTTGFIWEYGLEFESLLPESMCFD